MSTHPVAIVVAMDSELKHFVENVAIEREETRGPWRYRFGTVGKVPFVAVRSGIGMVNGAAATEAVIGAFSPRAVLNFGCTGAHREELLPGDVVIGDRAVPHGSVHILPDGSEYYAGFGYEVGAEHEAAAEVPCDPQLVDLARGVAASHQVSAWPDGFVRRPDLQTRAPEVRVGGVGSADIWTQQTTRIERLHLRHGTLCEDMEAASIGHVARLHSVPFLTIKDISNNEFHVSTDIVGGFTDFPTPEVGKRASALLIEVLEAMGSDTAWGGA